jgi:hypothetical protein
MTPGLDVEAVDVREDGGTYTLARSSILPAMFTFYLTPDTSTCLRSRAYLDPRMREAVDEGRPVDLQHYRVYDGEDAAQ